MDKTIPNERDDNRNTHCEHRVRNNLQSSGEKQTEEVYSNTRVVIEHINAGDNIVKTRYGKIIKKPDRLMYKYNHMNTCPADMLGAVKNVEQLPHLPA